MVHCNPADARVIFKSSLVAFLNDANMFCLHSEIEHVLPFLDIEHRRTRWWCLKCVIVYLARDIPPFVMYCVNGKPCPSLFIESTDSIIIRTKKHFKNEQRNRDAAAPKRANTSGVGESNNYYEDIYNIYTSLQQHSLTTPINSTH